MGYTQKLITYRSKLIILKGMSDLQTPVPTDAELEILQVLWGKSPETVRYVNDTLNGRRPADWQVGYTTTLKILPGRAIAPQAFADVIVAVDTLLSE